MNGRSLYLFFLLLALILAIRGFLFFNSYHAYEEGKIVKFSTTINQAPRKGINYQQISLAFPNHQRGFVKLNQDPELSYGDNLEISGIVSYIKTASGSDLLTLKYPKFRILAADESAFSILRNRIINFFSSNMSQNNSALMLGIVFGIKQDFSANFASNIQKTGLLHVIAASGMNITMIGGFFSGLLGVLFSRKLSILLTISIIAFYAILAGLEPSIIRASIMGIIVFTAALLGRQSTAFVALYFAGFTMLMIEPSLVLDTGFQLSFLATFGLIFFRPIFYNFKNLRKLIEKSVLGEDLLTTITAQIFTLPILVLSFGSYSPVSVLSNLLVLWTVPVLMILGGLAGIVGLIVEPLGKLTLVVSLPLLDFFTSIVNWLGQRSPTLTLNNVPFTIIVGYYLIVASLVIYFSKDQNN